MTAIDSQRPSWSDAPRQKTDIAGRPEFARAVADRIDCCIDGQDSTVFGLVGPWGSGKTTILRDIVGQLDNWKPVWFSPWSTADMGSLTTEFLAALAEAFPQSSSVKEKLAAYSRFGTPVLKMIPIFGEALSSLTTEAISDLTERPAWHTEFAKLNAEIKAQHARVLIVVDDVDRLDGDELRSLLRLVRLLGRFENVHYLLAYDQATIDEVLGTAGAHGASSEFMEKIVQYPFEVPPTPLVVRRRWCRSIIEAAGQTNSELSAEHVEQREQLVRILASGIETPRAAERLREQMFSLSGLAAEAEVNALDFTALTWLRISHHRVWDHIRLNSADYLSWREGESEATQLERMERLESLVGGGHAKPVQDAVSYIFEPTGLAGAYAGRKGRMQIHRYFHRYFQIGLADDDVSDRMVENALRELSNNIVDGADSLKLRSIILGPDEERSLLALEVAYSRRRASLETSKEHLDFVSAVHSGLTATRSLKFARQSIADQWLFGEIFLELSTKLVSMKDLLARFGYQTLIRSAYSVKRSHIHDALHIKRAYSDLAKAWVTEVRNETLDTTLARSELTMMTSFCDWSTDVEDHRGFLSERIASSGALIDAAMGYVSFEEWVGSGVTYDLVFRRDEFLFAVADSLAKFEVTDFPVADDVPSYGIKDRLDTDLTPTQRRDFAIGAVRALY